VSAIDVMEVQRLYRELLLALGQDADREGLCNTPRRVATFWQDFLSYEPGYVDTLFVEEHGSQQFVLVTGIETWSMCEHHLLPIHLRVDIGYVPAGAVLGLSKLVRITEMYARGLQLQERLVEQVANELTKVTGSEDVAVVAAGHHLCMSMRGVRAADARTLTQSLRGRFLHDPHLAAQLTATQSRGPR
jgi:GTP cyclohydrolase IA